MPYYMLPMWTSLECSLQREAGNRERDGEIAKVRNPLNGCSLKRAIFKIIKESLKGIVSLKRGISKVGDL